MQSVLAFGGKKVDDEAGPIEPKLDAKVPEIIASRTGQAIRFQQRQRRNILTFGRN
jgi:sigma54-dependent transcription regulator